METLKRGVRHRNLRTGAVCALVLLVALPALAAAKTNPLDPSFGDGGRVVRASGLGGRPWQRVTTFTANLPDGRLIVLAGNKLHAFEPDGSTAVDFGGGTVGISVPAGDQASFTGLAADSQGRLVVTGNVAPEGTMPRGPVPVPEDLMVARYTAQGTLDPSFGESGVLVTNFGLAPLLSAYQLPGLEATTVVQVHSSGVTIDAADRIVLTGSRVDGIGYYCRSNGPLASEDAFVARLDPSGKLDPSFREDGIVEINNIARLNAPVLDPLGGIYLSIPLYGRGPCTEFNSPRLIGHLTDGGIADLAFGEGGWLGLPDRNLTASNVSAVDAKGRLLLFSRHLVTGSPRKTTLVERFLANGRPDPGFGSGGTATLGVRSGSLLVSAAGVDAAGNVIVSGTFLPVGKSHGRRSFFIGRLTSTGKRDSGFGKAGVVRTLFGKGSKAHGSSLLIDGARATVAGTLESPLLKAGTGVAVAGYQGGGR